MSGDSAQWKQNPYGFKAGLRSSSTDNGLTKFGYRWQSSVTGGGIERDTLDAPLGPTNSNRYAYAASDPVNLWDPTGRSAGGAAVSGVVNGIGALGTAAACVTTMQSSDASRLVTGLGSLSAQPAASRAKQLMGR